MNLNELFWENIYKKNIAMMIGVCYRYVANRAIAEDLTHDAFITAIEKADSYKGIGSIDAWLRRIVVNTALQYLRKKRVELYSKDLTNEESHLVDISNDENDSESIRHIDFSEKELLDAIGILPEHHRLVFNLYVIDNYSHAQISEKLCISEGTSKSHLARARKGIQTELNKKALEKQKDWKRAYIFWLLPAKNSSIDKLFKKKLASFKMIPTNPLSINTFSLPTSFLHFIKPTLFTIKNLLIVSFSIAISLPVLYYSASNSQNKTTETKPMLVDSTITNTPDTIEINRKTTLNNSKNSTDTVISNEPTVIIKKQIIKKSTVIIKKPLIINDSTNGE